MKGDTQSEATKSIPLIIHDTVRPAHCPLPINIMLKIFLEAVSGGKTEFEEVDEIQDRNFNLQKEAAEENSYWTCAVSSIFVCPPNHPRQHPA
jgi:hypothetical protein